MSSKKILSLKHRKSFYVSITKKLNYQLVFYNLAHSYLIWTITDFKERTKHVYNVSQKQNIRLFFNHPGYLAMSTYLKSRAGPELYTPSFAFVVTKAVTTEYQVARS